LFSPEVAEAGIPEMLTGVGSVIVVEKLCEQPFASVVVTS